MVKRSCHKCNVNKKVSWTRSVSSSFPNVLCFFLIRLLKLPNEYTVNPLKCLPFKCLSRLSNHILRHCCFFFSKFTWTPLFLLNYYFFILNLEEETISLYSEGEMNSRSTHIFLFVLNVIALGEKVNPKFKFYNIFNTTRCFRIFFWMWKTTQYVHISMSILRCVKDSRTEEI